MDLAAAGGVDETLSLDVGLNGLGMLSTVTNARQEYLSEMRLGRTRSNSCSPLWRSDLTPRSTSSGPPTKENCRGLDSSVLYSISGCHLNKMLQRRSRRNRISPYCRRKPLNTIIPSCRSSSGTGSPTTSLSSDEGERGLTPITQLFQQHLSLRQTHLSHSHNTGTTVLPSILNLQGQPLTSAPVSVDVFPEQQCNLAAKMKTDCDSNFPVPLLTRSKSLEDLRESVKPKTKSLSSYVCGCGGVSTVDVTLSPRLMRGNNEQLLRSRREQAWSSLDSSQNIKTEIDSMSIRIQKLDM